MVAPQPVHCMLAAVKKVLRRALVNMGEIACSAGGDGVCRYSV